MIQHKLSNPPPHSLYIRRNFNDDKTIMINRRVYLIYQKKLNYTDLLNNQDAFITCISFL